jgi:Transposase, Mutator family
MLTTFVNALMSAEADAIRGAPYGMPDPDRVNVRNGYRHRDFDTRAGTLDVAIPKLRSGSYFPDWLLERRRRAEAALTTVVATCYLLGVSTRRMEKLAESLGITRLSKSQVSVMAAELDAAVEDFRTRPLDAAPYTFVAADALVLKVREGGRGALRRAPGDPRPAGHQRRGRRRVAGVLPGPDRPGPGRRGPGHLRCAPRADRGRSGSVSPTVGRSLAPATLVIANFVAVERRSASSVRHETSLDAYVACRADGSGMTADWGWVTGGDSSLLAISFSLTATAPGLRNIGPTTACLSRVVAV